ncbi:hypothetical protein M409DRAFT_37559 [Zasmidium cellare ATCC 36951]|uniref:C2H2-type domain-containing protein n=1 Tax=Zasmidium cellare ATCC 36951 TaxID=1080233 RepID=A0A6A6C2S9_ZASCE|nr:uncharacterized protein M409DRAFT_37559 [Zasmidium cellare ATCC 36951]KAF2161437.1 hypothetical protein M409DRAFT_37559 [Zasmidium cellare ATCC 36951]
MRFSIPTLRPAPIDPSLEKNSGHTSWQPSISSGSRPFPCGQCSRAFKCDRDLQRHKCIHVAPKPFPCGHCHRSFSRKDTLKVCSTVQ